MSVFESRALRLLKDKLADLILNRSQALAAGGAADYAGYKQAVGFVKGLEAALQLADDVDKDLNS